MKKRFWAVLAVLLGMTGCQGNVGTGQADTAQAALESQQTTAEVTTEQTSKIIETTSTTAAEEVSADIAVSREYEFDLDKYLERAYTENYLLRDELDFLSDEQYDTYIRALIMLDRLLYFDVPCTGDVSAYFIDENGEISESHTTQELGKTHIYPYYYVSTYQSFYEYLQSVFTQEAIDEIMSNDIFWTVDDELYCKLGDRGGPIYFNGGEYNLIEKNDDEVIFEYIAHQANNGNEWTETHSLKLVNTDNGWRSEFFENLYVERNMPYQYMVDVDLSRDYDYGRKYEFDLDKFLENGKHDVYLLRNELDFLSDEQYDTYIKALIFVDYLGNSSVVSTDSKSLHFINENGEISKSLISNESDTVQVYPYYYISTYKSFYEYLQSVFTQDAVDEIMSDERFFTFGDELYFKWQDSGGMVYFDDSEYKVIEENDSEIAFEYTAHKLINSEEWVCTRKTKLVHTDNGWRSEFFKNLYSEK